MAKHEYGTDILLVYSGDDNILGEKFATHTLYTVQFILFSMS